MNMSTYEIWLRLWNSSECLSFGILKMNKQTTTITTDTWNGRGTSMSEQKKAARYVEDRVCVCARLCGTGGTGKAWAWDSKTIRSTRMRQEKSEKNKIEMKDSTKAHSQPNQRVRHPNNRRRQWRRQQAWKLATKKEPEPKQKEQKRQTCPAIMAAINVIMAWNLHGNRFYVLHKLRNNKFLFVIIFHGRCVAMRFPCIRTNSLGHCLSCGWGDCRTLDAWPFGVSQRWQHFKQTRNDQIIDIITFAENRTTHSMALIFHPEFWLWWNILVLW